MLILHPQYDTLAFFDRFNQAIAKMPEPCPMVLSSLDGLAIACHGEAEAKAKNLAAVVSAVYALHDELGSQAGINTEGLHVINGNQGCVVIGSVARLDKVLVAFIFPAEVALGTALLSARLFCEQL
jgi:predicted regulator of Ras-like GTPase activity (Roadblock/LC7/MglB family)